MVGETATSVLSYDSPSAWQARSEADMDTRNTAFRQRRRLNASAFRDQLRFWEIVCEPAVTSVEYKHVTVSASHTAADLVAAMLARLSWKDTIDNADSKAEIITLVRISGLNSTADRLAYLDMLARDDPEEETIELESLRRFAVFALGRHLPGPKIGVSSEGLIHTAWWVDNGILSMDFLPSGEIRFSAILQDVQWSAKGVMPPDRMLAKIRRFRRALADDER